MLSTVDKMMKRRQTCIVNLYADHVVIIANEQTSPSACLHICCYSYLITNKKLIGSKLIQFQRSSFEIFKMAAGRHLGFCATGSSPIRSAIPENRIIETDTKSIGQPVPEISSNIVRASQQPTAGVAVYKLYDVIAVYVAAKT